MNILINSVNTYENLSKVYAVGQHCYFIGHAHLTSFLPNCLQSHCTDYTSIRYLRLGWTTPLIKLSNDLKFWYIDCIFYCILLIQDVFQ